MFHVGAGQRLKPTSWPGGARVAVGLSFDVDNATATLSTGNLDYEVISRGEYGAVDGLPRILRMLERQQLPASFFIPAVSVELHPQMIKDIQASKLESRNWHSRLDSRAAARAEQRAGGAAAARPVPGNAHPHGRHAPGRLPRAVVEVQPVHAGPDQGCGVPLRQQPHGQRRCLRAAAGWPADRPGGAADRAHPGRCPVLRRQRRRIDAVAVGGPRGLPVRVRRRLPGGRAVPADHASAHDGTPLARGDAREAGWLHEGEARVSGSRRTSRLRGT